MTEIIPGANIISGKASVASVNRAGGVWAPQEVIYRVEPPKKILGSKEHLDWLKLDLNAVKIRTVQDYIHTPKININIQAKDQAGNVWVKYKWQHKKAKVERKSARDLRNLI